LDETLSQDENLMELINALTEISHRDWVENALDPQWPARRAREALEIYLFSNQTQDAQGGELNA
jgi:hypothetical protein